MKTDEKSPTDKNEVLTLDYKLKVNKIHNYSDNKVKIVIHMYEWSKQYEQLHKKKQMTISKKGKAELGMQMSNSITELAYFLFANEK